MAKKKISELNEYSGTPDQFFVPGVPGSGVTNKADLGKMIERKISSLQDLLGLYTDREPLTLSAQYSGKAIVAPRGAKLGALTDYPGASVSVEYSVTRGDMLLIKPGKTSNDYFTVAQVTEQNGVKLYEKVMSLNELAEVPTDGYLRFLVMPSDMVIVVTFFSAEAAFDQTIRVMRCGAFATISTQVGNIYADLKENYAKAQGYYKDLHCGVADSLGADPSKTYTEVIPCGRPLGNAGSLTDGTGGSHDPKSIGEVSTVEIKSIEGDCFGGNQILNLTNQTSSGIKATKQEDGYMLVEGTASGTANIRHTFSTVAGRKYLSLLGGSITPSAILVNTGGSSGSIRLNSGAVYVASVTDNSRYIIIRYNEGVSESGRYIADLLDLTTLFPTPSGQSFVSTLNPGPYDHAAQQAAASKVLDRLAFFAFLSES